MPRTSLAKRQVINNAVSTETEYPCTYVVYITTMFYGVRIPGSYYTSPIPDNPFTLGTTPTTKLNTHQRNFVICKITQIPFKQTTKPPKGTVEFATIKTPSHNESVFDGKDDVYKYEYTYIVIPFGSFDSRNIVASKLDMEGQEYGEYFHVLVDLFISANKYIDSKHVKYNKIYDVSEIPITNNISHILVKEPVYYLAKDHISKLWWLLNNNFIYLAGRHYKNELGGLNSLLFIAPGTYSNSHAIASRCEYKSSGNPITINGVLKYTHTQYGKSVDMSGFTVNDVISKYYRNMYNIDMPCISDTQVTYERQEQLDYLNMLMEISRYVPAIYDNFTSGYYFMDNGTLALSFYIKDELAKIYLEPKSNIIDSSEYLRLNMFSVGNSKTINGFSFTREDENGNEDEEGFYNMIYHKDTDHYYPPLSSASTKKSIESKFASYDLIKAHINGTAFSYQKRNVVWMDDFEAKVRSGTATIQTEYTNLASLIAEYSHTTLVDREFYMCGEKRHLVMNSSGSSALLASDPNQFGNTIKYTGGILADSVGLGKTFSIICHLVNQIENDRPVAGRPAYELNTLIIVPPRLIKQWKYEFDKYVKNDELEIMTISSITDIKKMYKKNLKFEGKADVYIMSSNILNNKNYLNYVYMGWQVNIDEPYKLDQYFDIFRIKWNRLILDEAHEKIITNSNWNNSNSYYDSKLLTKADREVSMNIIFNLHANYTWGMTATPFEHKANNLLAYMLWLSSDYKTDLSKQTVLKELYSDNMSGFTNAFHTAYNNINLLPRLFKREETIAFQKMCISKTTKKLVSGEIKIPIFTEDIKMIDLTNIETNIYNNAKTDSTFTERREADRIRRMFQLCTNICISTYDLNAMGLTADKVVTLEELNKAMVKHFGKLLVEATANVDELKNEIPLVTEKKKLSESIIVHMDTNYMELNQVSYSDKRRLKNMIDSAFAHDTEKYGNYVATDLEVEALKKLRKVMYRRLLECNNDNYDNILLLCTEILDSLDSRPEWSEREIIYIVYYFIGTYSSRAVNSIKSFQEQIAKGEREMLRLQNQIKLFESNDFIKEKTAEPCTICWMEYSDSSRVVVTDCRHIMCGDCFAALCTNKKTINCPECREDIDASKVRMTTMAELNDKPADQSNALDSNQQLANENWRSECISKYGTKMATLIEYLKSIFADVEKNNRAIVFSQYDNMLKLIGRTLDEYGIKNVYCRGNVHVLNKNIDAFKRDNSIRVIMLSSEHSNSGSNLTEASHIILVDVLNMDAEQTKAVESQAIGRAVRLGQNKPVKVVRLITRGTVEDEYYNKNKYDILSIQ